MATDPYIALKKAVEFIRGLLLPDRLDPLGEYSDEELVRTDAYLAFCHAEIEYYLEQLVLRVLHWTERLARSDTFDGAGAALILYYRGDRDSVPSINKVPTLNVMRTQIMKFHSEHSNFAREGNHGIKEKSVCKLFLPLGFRFDNVSSTLLAELDGLGSMRGKLAHQSVLESQRREIRDPALARQKVEGLVLLLADFDDECVAQFGSKLDAPVP